MGKVVKFPAEEAPARWYVDLREGKEHLDCRYVEEAESYIHPEAHWRVDVVATTVNRLQAMLTEAEKLLKKKQAVRRGASGSAAGRRRKT